MSLYGQYHVIQTVSFGFVLCHEFYVDTAVCILHTHQASPGYAPGITSIYCDAKSRPAPTQAQYVLFLFSVVSAQCHRMHLEHLEQHDIGQQRQQSACYEYTQSATDSVQGSANIFVVASYSFSFCIHRPIGILYGVSRIYLNCGCYFV